jgi:hypothetical protein
LIVLNKILTRLRKKGFKINLRKSFFAVGEFEYLGYWVTREGIQPQTRKVDAILKILPPRTKKQVRSFLGMINYYRDMWHKRSHLILPLAALSSKSKPFTWTEQCQKSFEDITKIVAQEVLLNYPNFGIPFDIFTDASERQLGTVIMQNNKPIAFYSRKLNPAQCKYTTGEQELLSIVKTVKQYQNILLGYDIKVFTDHKNTLALFKAIIR